MFVSFLALRCGGNKSERMHVTHIKATSVRLMASPISQSVSKIISTPFRRLRLHFLKSGSSPPPSFLGACGCQLGACGCQLGACGNNGVSERFSFCLFLGACGSNGVGSLSWLLEQRENEIDPFSDGAACFLCCDQLKALVSFWRLIGAAASGFLPPWLAAAAAALEADRRWLDSAVWHCLVTNFHWQ